MTHTEEMTTSEILLRLASMRNELLQVVNDIEKISKNICYKAEQTENSSEKPNNCEPQTDYKKWDALPKVKLPTGEITTCVSVLAAAFEEASAFEEQATDRKE